MCFNCVWQYTNACECVPQWCCGQQLPGWVVWTRVRPGAQLTEDLGHRLTSQTATHGRGCTHDIEDGETDTHTHSFHLPQWYWGQQLFVLLKSTARISPYEHVGIGSIHDSHTAQTKGTNHWFISACVVVKLSTIKVNSQPQALFYVGQKCCDKHTTQIGVATGFFPPDLHKELILSAAEGWHRRACHGVTLWKEQGRAKCLKGEHPFEQNEHSHTKYINNWQFILTTSVLWAAGQSAVADYQPVVSIARWCFAVTDGHVTFWKNN